MKTIKYNKLIRDRIPEIIKKNGAFPTVFRLNNAKFVRELKKKLIEESRELQNAKGKENLLNELADVLEILVNIAKTNKIVWSSVEIKRKKKNKERGAFNRKLFLEKVREPSHARK